MNPLLVRRLKILGYMALYGLAWGAVAGGVVGFGVGLFAFLVGAIFGLPYGALLGAQVGVVVGLICGLVTLRFESRSAAGTREYRTTITRVSVIVTPLLVYLRIMGIALPNPNTHWVVLLAITVLGVLFARVVSRRLVNSYAERFAEGSPVIS